MCLGYETNMTDDLNDIKQRLNKFAMKRKPIFYDKSLQHARHLHFSSSSWDGRLLENYYGNVTMTVVEVVVFLVFLI